MAQFRILALVLALAVAESLTVGSKSQVSVNPIRRVVTLLQNMQKKVEAEGEKEEDLFEKFMCYCKNGKGDLEASIEAAKTKNEALMSSIEETASQLKQSKADLKTAQEDRARQRKLWPKPPVSGRKKPLHSLRNPAISRQISRP
jgi:hypothetical protein